MSGPTLRRLALCAAVAGLAGCGQSNTYQAPPPPKVTVAPPVQQSITRYFEATGNTAAINQANNAEYELPGGSRGDSARSTLNIARILAFVGIGLSVVWGITAIVLKVTNRF